MVQIMAWKEILSADGTHMPMILADEAITASSRDIDWSKYDLNGDKKVDRLLILHTSPSVKRLVVILTEYGHTSQPSKTQ